MFKKIKKLSYEIEADLRKIRREIHRNPELALQEFKTAGLVAEKLKALGLEVTENVGETGVVGLLKGKEPGKTVALRADMDALPIEEQNTHEFRSIHPNIMHACGHDAHTAVLLGAAEILSRLKDSLKGNIKFIFQPSEEGGPGGADEMIRQGVLRDPEVDAAFALHVYPGLPVGQIGYREGAFFASTAFFEIELIGKGGHGAMPHKSINPILIAAECVQALQTIASSKIDPMEPFTLTLGSIQGGQKANIIPEKVCLEGTVRCFSDEIMYYAANAMENIIRSITIAHGATYKFEFNTGVKTVINDKDMIGLIKEAAEEIVGYENVTLVPQVLLGDDFGSFSQLVPSAYVYLGIGCEGRENYPLHHPKFDLDERALPIGSALLSYSVLKFLDGD